ncbi:sodium:alanine symporter, partial [Pseudomonas sp. NPDC088885]
MLEVINDFLSGKVLIVLIVGLGSYFTIRSRFVQLRHFIQNYELIRDS